MHGNTNLELAWTVAPVLILARSARSSSTSSPGSQDVPSASARRPRRRDGRGPPYYWNFTYPNGVIAVDKLRAPVGQTTSSSTCRRPTTT